MTTSRRNRIERMIRKLRNCPELWQEETEMIITAKIDRAKSLLAPTWEKEAKERRDMEFKRKYELGVL